MTTGRCEKSNKKIYTAQVAVTALMALCLAACSVGKDKLDEAVFIDRPGLGVKLVRYYEDLPWHFTGETYTVYCATPQAQSRYAAAKTPEAGWREIDGGAAIGSKSAQEIVQRIQPNYHVVDDQTLMIVGAGRFRASFDGCRTLVAWSMHNIPDEFVIQAPKPEYCQKLDPRSCRSVNFDGDRELQISNASIDPQSGHISFVAKSKAFKGGIDLAVSSRDRGTTWTTVAVK